MPDKKTTNLNELSRPHQQMIDSMKDQLLIVLIRRLAGIGKELRVPVSEMDNTGGVNLAMRVDYDDGGTLVFEVKEKG